MSVMEIISLVLGVIVTASLCLWIGLGYRLWVMHRTKPVIREGLSLPNPIDAMVSIIIPAHNIPAFKPAKTFVNEVKAK